jgi:MFS family permease
MPKTTRSWFSNPWWIVFGSTAAMLVAQAPVILFTFGVFIKPLAQEFGWDRAQLSGASGMASLASAVAVPFIGMLADRWGVRRVMMPAIVLFAVSMAALSLTPPSMLVFMTLMIVAGVCGAGQGPIGYVKSISGWFDDKRGLALGIAVAGIGLGAALVPQFAQFMISSFGWRYAYIGLAAALLLIALPCVIFFVREPTEGVARRRADEQGNDLTPVDILPGLDIKEAVSSWRFWMLGVSVFLVSTVVNGMAVHTVPILTDRGYSAAQAAGLMGAFGLSTLTGRVLAGFLVDFIFAPYVAVFFFLCPVFGMYLLESASTPVLGIISVGLASGTEVDMVGYLTSRYFGLKRFGQIYGYMFAIFTAGSAAGPWVLGLSFVAYQSYIPAMEGFAGCLIAASLLVLCIGPYRFPPRRRGMSGPAPATEAAKAQTA